MNAPIVATALIFAAIALSPEIAPAREIHVAVTGNDAADGSASAPLKTISAAATLAQPGDTITVHAGIYRECIAPPRGGTSDSARITYQAAPGEKVTITGSEPVKGWEKVAGDTWKLTLPNTFFGPYNPYADRIHGDWFSPKGRQHHTGAVYLDGHWLIEAASHLNEVLAPAGKQPLWFAKVDNAQDSDYLLNLASLTVASHTIPATTFSAKSGEQHSAKCSEGGQCIGWILAGNSLTFDNVPFGPATESISFRAASVTGGGNIEIHLDKPDGELLGLCTVADTGDWQKWQTFTAKIKPTAGQKNLCLVFRSAKTASDNTTLYAQFPNLNPNEANVEINVRKTVFSPDKPGINYITLRGFDLRNAATNWAPPTAGQIGLVSAYWCKGWIIENNQISYSKCSGVALGKYADEWDNRAGTAEGYVGTLTRAFKNGWNKDTVGSHIVRNNHIHHCEQTGIVGSLGCSFSTITGNVIHDIYVHKLFAGAEMAAIKFHGAIDVQITRNHIYRSGTFGIWLDWMAQGVRVSSNLLHDNDGPDLFFEVDHGPMLVDNNLLLSPKTLLSQSQGVAFAHNLIAGNFRMIPYDARKTPFHKNHSTEVAALHDNTCGDFRYFNNLFVQRGDVSPLDNAKLLPIAMEGNVFTKGAKSSKYEKSPTLLPDTDPALTLTEKPDGWYLSLPLDKSLVTSQPRKLVTTDLLGPASVPNLPFENPDGSLLKINTDYFGNQRNESTPTPGPIESPTLQPLKIWPIQ